MDLPTESALQPYLRALWERLDAAVQYPDELVKRRIAGDVTLQLEVDRRGVFTGRVVSVEGGATLAAYVTAVSTHALREPLPVSRWGDRDEMTLVARFEFRTFGPGEIPPAREREQFKNVFAFRRWSYIDPALNEKIERLVREYMPPFIPLQGWGWYIDFVRIYEAIRDRGKIEEATLRRDRLDLKREQWNRPSRQ